MKKSYIMFLDFDGPLFSNRALMLPENNEYAKEVLQELKLNPLVSYWCADPIAIAMLIELYRFQPFQLVISSNWANSELHTKEQIETLLKRNGLGIPFHKNWMTPRDNDSKIIQIQNWLENNEHKDYIILDDNESGEEFDDYKLIKETNINRDKVVLVDYQDGILTKDFYRMKAILATW